MGQHRCHKKASEQLVSRTEHRARGTQGDSVPGTSKKKNEEFSKLRQQVCAASTPCQTTQTFMETQEATGVIFYRRKPYPGRAEPARAQPEASAHRVSAAVSPVSASAAAASCGKEKNSHPLAVGICRGLSLFAQLTASPRTTSQNRGPTKAHISVY